MLAASMIWAQNEKPVMAVSNKDTTSVNRQLQKEADMKTMDAVKTNDHESAVKPKNASKTKDTTKVKKRAQR